MAAKKMFIFIPLFIISCGEGTDYSATDGGACGEEDHFEKCATDRYATYYTLVQCLNGAVEGKCFSGQCAPMGEYSFWMALKKSTCEAQPKAQYGFTDHIATGSHPLRFLLLCGYNRVVIDEAWGANNQFYGGVRYQIFEGKAENNAIRGEYAKIYHLYQAGNKTGECEDVYYMTINLAERM